MFITHASTPTTLPSSCPVLSHQCHLIKLGSEEVVVEGIIAGCQMLVNYVVVVRRALNWFGEISGVKPRDKLGSTESLG